MSIAGSKQAYKAYKVGWDEGHSSTSSKLTLGRTEELLTTLNTFGMSPSDIQEMKGIVEEGFNQAKKNFFSLDSYFDSFKISLVTSTKRLRKEPSMAKTKKVITHNGIVLYENAAGELHRTNGPAVIYPSGAVSYYINGKLHRVGGPALTFANGDKFWYKNGVSVKPF